MYYGSLRYWLYTVYMTPSVRRRVQAEADILLWSKTPDLEAEPKRYRRWVKERTALGPREAGGLNTLPWSEHVDAFMAEWILKYVVNPSKAAWKDVLDEMLLYEHKADDNNVMQHTPKEPEGRAILFYPLQRGFSRNRLTRTLPPKAKYIRECLSAHWRLNMKRDLSTLDGIQWEPIWHNERFEIKASNALRLLLGKTVGIKRIIDFIN